MAKRNVKRSLQQGATLIVSLVILAVVTLLGVASMRSSNLELRMAASARDRAVAFQRAEAALTRVERRLATNPYLIGSFDSNCSGTCFNAACTGGLCFNGEFDSQGSRKQCKLAGSGGVEQPAWMKEDFWKEDGPYLEIDVPGAAENSTPEPVKYVIEFLCFAPSGGRDIYGGAGGVVREGDTDVPLYRITARAAGEAGRSAVILQSVYRAAR
ncbi:MAG: PilX N-terminal domain-containing pilus assembly protein [Cellvibrionaceae bacterium]|nr:PilX N-terminal domain-containing pilus assembly protein [Cellvibrionaceae bacterium]